MDGNRFLFFFSLLALVHLLPSGKSLPVAMLAPRIGTFGIVRLHQVWPGRAAALTWNASAKLTDLLGVATAQTLK